MFEINRNGKPYKLRFAEHLIHHKNLESVFIHGILSHNEAYRNNFINNDISLDDVQKIRDDRKDTIHKRPIHDYVSFYFNTKNPMLFKRRSIQEELVIILIDIEIVNEPNTIFTDGNSANLHPNTTKYFSGQHNLLNIPFETIFSESWNDPDPEIKKENVRRKCSEILAYPSVSASLIKRIICPNQNMYDFVLNLKELYMNETNHMDVKLNKTYFF